MRRKVKETISGSKGRLAIPPSLSSIHEDVREAILGKQKIKSISPEQSSRSPSQSSSSPSYKSSRPSPGHRLKLTGNVQKTWSPSGVRLPVQKPMVRPPSSEQISPSVSPTCTSPIRRNSAKYNRDYNSSSDDESPRMMDSLLAAPAVLRIVDNLKSLQKKRISNEVTEEVFNIHKRVREALENSDLGIELEDEEHKLPPLFFDTKAKREKIQNQKKVMDRLNRYQKDCKLREQILTELDSWMEDSKLPDNFFLRDEEMVSMVSEFEDIYDDVMGSIDIYSGVSERVIKVGKELLKETGAIIKENEASARKIREKLKDKASIVYDERQLLADQVKWDSAVKLILVTFEDAIKWTKNNMYKQAYGKGQKQFKNLVMAVSKRQSELVEKRRNIEEITRKLNSTKTSLDRHIKEIENLRVQLSKANMEVQDKTKALNKSEEKNKMYQSKLTETENKCKNLKDELDNKPPTPEPPPAEIVEVKVVDSATKIKLNKAEAELFAFKQTVAELREKINSLEKQAVLDQENLSKLRSELEKAEEALKEAESVSEPDFEPPETVLPVVSDSADKDIGYYKTLLAGIRNDFTIEMDKLKAHHKKEKLRTEAQKRRLEQTHKEQLNAIQKDVLRVLRAIMHFRDFVQGVLEKENLGDQAAALQRLDSLIPDQLVPDPRELLALLVGKVVDYLHHMEEILSTAFLAMRLMIRGSMPPPETPRKADPKIVKECETKIKTLELAKGKTKEFAHQLKKAKKTLKKFEQDTNQQVADQKYLRLIKRYGLVWKMYTKLQMEMDELQDDFKSKLNEEVDQREALLIRRMKIDLKERRESHEQELRLNIADQRENLKILDKAYQENKISRDLHMMASSLLQKAMEIPRKRLGYMVEKYIAMRSVTDTKARVESLISDTTLNTEVRRELKSYVQRVDKKFSAKMDSWHTEIEIMEDERRKLSDVIWTTFNNVLAETGLLLVHPLFQAAGDRATVYKNLAHTVKKDKIKKLMKKRTRHIAGMLELPTVLTGSPIKLHSDDNGYWDSEYMSQEQPMSKIDTPYMMSYDIHRNKIEARRNFGKIVKVKYPLANSMNYSISLEHVRC